MQRPRSLMRRIPLALATSFAVFMVLPQQGALAAQTSRAAQSVCTNHNGLFEDITGAYWLCDLPGTTPAATVDSLASICSHVSDGTFTTGGGSGGFNTNTRCVYGAP